MFRVIPRIVCFCLLATVALSSPVRATSPMEEVRTNVDAIFNILRNSDTAWEERRDTVHATVRGWFDFRLMSQGVLGDNWKKASVEERDRFTRLFTEFLEATYCDRINNFGDERVEYLGEKVEGNKAEVDIIIYSGGSEIPITYRLIEREGHWPVYDVVIDGVGLIHNYRDSYREIISNEGLESLLTRLAEKIKSCRSAIKESDVDRSLVP